MVYVCVCEGRWKKGDKENREQEAKTKEIPDPACS